MNTDQMNMVNARETVQVSFGALTAIQDQRPHVQVMALAYLFNEMCAVLGLDPSEMHDKARRMRRNAEDHYSLEAHALHDYINHELKNK